MLTHSILKSKPYILETCMTKVLDKSVSLFPNSKWDVVYCVHLSTPFDKHKLFFGRIDWMKNFPTNKIELKFLISWFVFWGEFFVVNLWLENDFSSLSIFACNIYWETHMISSLDLDFAQISLWNHKLKSHCELWSMFIYKISIRTQNSSFKSVFKAWNSTTALWCNLIFLDLIQYIVHKLLEKKPTLTVATIP